MVNFLLFFGGVVVGVVIEHFFFKKDCSTPDDPTGENKQAIFDAIKKLKQDIETTV